MPYLTIKKNIRVKLPEENVEYTFVFPGKKIISYVYICLREDKRIVLMNTKTKQFTNMTASWFAKLRKRQLISEKPYNETVWADKPKREEKVVEVKEETWEEKVIRELRGLTPAQAFAVHVKIGRTAEELAGDLERLFNDKEDNYTQEFVNRVCREMTVARDCYLSLQNKPSNGLFKASF